MESRLSLIHFNEEDVLTPLRCIRIHSRGTEKPTTKRGCSALCAIRTVKRFKFFLWATKSKQQNILVLWHFPNEAKCNADEIWGQWGDKQKKMPQMLWIFFFFLNFRKQYLSEYSEWSLCCIAISFPVFKDVQKYFFLRCPVMLCWMIMPWCRRINDWNEQQQ